MYDRQTNSLWSQLGMQAVTGPMAGLSLSILPAEFTTWEDWSNRHPQTSVLSFNTGYVRDYDRDPYADLPMNRKEAAAVFFGGMVKLYPLEELKKAGGEVADDLQEEKIRLRYDAGAHQLAVTGEAGITVNYFIAFLADLRAFYPDAPVFQSKQKR